jgi:hypothetical protein
MSARQRLASADSGPLECERACGCVASESSLLGSPPRAEWRRASFSAVCRAPPMHRNAACTATVPSFDGGGWTVVRGSTWRAAIWSGSRERASNCYIERARALYRPGARWDQGVRLRGGDTVCSWRCGARRRLQGLRALQRPVASTLGKQSDGAHGQPGDGRMAAHGAHPIATAQPWRSLKAPRRDESKSRSARWRMCHLCSLAPSAAVKGSQCASIVSWPLAPTRVRRRERTSAPPRCHGLESAPPIPARAAAIVPSAGVRRLRKLLISPMSKLACAWTLYPLSTTSTLHPPTPTPSPSSSIISFACLLLVRRRPRLPPPAPDTVQCRLSCSARGGLVHAAISIDFRQPLRQPTALHSILCFNSFSVFAS